MHTLFRRSTPKVESMLRFMCLLLKSLETMITRELFASISGIRLIQKRLSSMLISDSKYAFLKELGLSEESCGVFNGEWRASGALIESLCPSNNEIIACVKTGMFIKFYLSFLN